MNVIDGNKIRIINCKMNSLMTFYDIRKEDSCFRRSLRTFVKQIKTKNVRWKIKFFTHLINKYVTIDILKYEMY